MLEKKSIRKLGILNSKRGTRARIYIVLSRLQRNYMPMLKEQESNNEVVKVVPNKEVNV
jgi:hypothetical protein